MTDTQPAPVVAAEVEAAAARQKGFAVASVCLGAAALGTAFVPFGAIPAGILAVAGLSSGVVCLIREPGFNLMGLGGTVLSSASASVVIVVAVIRGLGG